MTRLVTLEEYIEYGGKLKNLELRDTSYNGGDAKYHDAGNIKSITSRNKINFHEQPLYRVEFEKACCPSMTGTFIAVRVEMALDPKYL